MEIYDFINFYPFYPFAGQELRNPFYSIYPTIYDTEDHKPVFFFSVKINFVVMQLEMMMEALLQKQEKL